MATTPVRTPVQQHRAALRRAGLRPVQIWVPDTHRPDFSDECRRQSQKVTAADQRDPALQQELDEAAADLDGWTA